MAPCKGLTARQVGLHLAYFMASGAEEVQGFSEVSVGHSKGVLVALLPMSISNSVVMLGLQSLSAF